MAEPPQATPVATSPGTHSTRGLVSATIATTMVVLPMFLLGGMSVLLREELGFDEAALGISAGSFFTTTSLVSVFGGRLAERIGARRGMFLAMGITTAALLSAALLARSWTTLTATMVLAGVGNGVGQPASNLALARVVSDARQGIAFGIKQSAIPLAGLVAGITLPLIGLTLGWRWAFGLAIVGAVTVIVLTPPIPGRHAKGASPRREGDVPLGPLVVLALGSMLGTLSATTLGAFFVESLVTAGVATGTAGLLLSLGSVSSIVTRLISGWQADRREGRHLVVISIMLAIGTTGYACLAFAQSHLVVAMAGTLLAFALGWGWPGLFFMAVVKLNPNAPAVASGITLMGGAAGGMLGPALFGLVVTRAGYSTAWLCGQPSRSWDRCSCWPVDSACCAGGAAANLAIRMQEAGPPRDPERSSANRGERRRD